MQVYKGLEITTNKISLHERQNIPHHYLAEFERYFREYPSEKVESLKGKAGRDQMRRVGLESGRSCDGIAGLVVVEVAMRVNIDGLLQVERHRLRRNESERKE
ncbi:hypothetical protein Patl1_15013 [Pistacia atlantica]|uniref:Uncharacterized protein n=1 Tax=Pistacia atlantica TaxID=434234 RepID=A0ACC1B9S1_9ROSI|nr:hypothetical protein Patl1_15013 [Pistacia atlantica]